MSDFSWWFKNILFSNVWFVNKHTRDRFPAHAICLSANSFFNQLFRSYDINASMLKKDPNDDKIIIEVSSLRVAEIYVKHIYSNKYCLEDINIDLNDRDEILELLHYSEMWFVSEQTINVNFEYVLANTNNILTTDINLAPELYHFFDRDINRSSGKSDVDKLLAKILDYMGKNPEKLNYKMLDWNFSAKFTYKIFMVLMKTCDDPKLIYEYYKRFSNIIKINNIDIINIVHGLEDPNKVNQFFRCIKPEHKSIITPLINRIAREPELTFYSKFFDICHLSMIAYSDRFVKTSDDICDYATGWVDYLVLENLYPFIGKMYLPMSEISENYKPKIINVEVSNKLNPILVIEIIPKCVIKVGDSIYFNKLLYIISNIYFNNKEISQALPYVPYAICLRNTKTSELITITEIPEKCAIMYKVCVF